MSTSGSQNRISQERLNEIALKKLRALGVSAKVGTQGYLEGELRLSPGKVNHPSTGASISAATFQVVGHDQLLFLSAPLSGLAPVQFYDLDSGAALEQRILQLLHKRVAVLKELDPKLKALGLTTSLEVDQLCLKTSVKMVDQTYELLAGPGGVRVVRVVPRKGEPLVVPDAMPVVVPLQGFTTLAELELYLEAIPDLRLESGASPASGKPAPPARSTAGVRMLAAPSGTLLLHTLSRFSEDGAYLTPDDVVTTVAAELEVDGKRYRFTASHDRDTMFHGRLVGPTGEKWKERFDAARFPGLVPFVRSILGVPVEAPAAVVNPSEKTQPGLPPANRSVTLPSLPAHLIPQPGEVWVMNVVVERDDGNEVRYVCTNIDGHPYGAPRVLKKSDFQAVFAQQGSGWRLRIRIISLGADGVSYQQLSPTGELSPSVKKIAPNIFASNFLPEAAAY